MRKVAKRLHLENAAPHEQLRSLSSYQHLSLAGCYAKNFGPKGFGYGQGAGALVHAQ